MNAKLSGPIEIVTHTHIQGERSLKALLQLGVFAGQPLELLLCLEGPETVLVKSLRNLNGGFQELGVLLWVPVTITIFCVLYGVPVLMEKAKSSSQAVDKWYMKAVPYCLHKRGHINYQQLKNYTARFSLKNIGLFKKIQARQPYLGGSLN